MLRTTSGYGAGEAYQPRTGKSRDTISSQKDTISKIFEEGNLLSSNAPKVLFHIFHNPSFNGTKNLYILSISPQNFCLILYWAA